MADEYSFVADYYDHVAPYRDRPDIRFYVDLAREFGGPVLEVGCGTGRILLPTARAGVAIAGLDNSAAMLDLCRDRLASEPTDVRSRVRLVAGDMTDFDAGGPFVLATAPFRPLQHLVAVDDQLAALRAIRLHLRPDGRLCFDVFYPNLARLAEPVDPKRAVMEEPPVQMPDGRRVGRRHFITRRDVAAQTFDVEIVYDVAWPDGRKETPVHRFTMRWFYRYELEHLLARAGFAVEAVWGDFDRTPMGPKPPTEMIVLARAD